MSGYNRILNDFPTASRTRLTSLSHRDGKGWKGRVVSDRRSRRYAVRHFHTRSFPPSLAMRGDSTGEAGTVGASLVGRDGTRRVAGVTRAPSLPT